MSIVLLDETNDANSDDLRVVHFFLNLTIDCLPRFGNAYAYVHDRTWKCTRRPD